MPLLAILLLAAIPIREIDAYRTALAHAESVEQTFAAALAVRKALLPVIEELSEEEFQEAQELKGLIVNRDEVLIVQPDPRFFLALAKERGSEADVAFFEEYAATFPDGVWPSYVVQLTDIAGCTTFGSGELLARYEGWRKFRRRFPDAYRSAAAERIAEIEQQFGEGTCACGEAEETRKELERFAARFPRSAPIGKVRTRIRALQRGTSDIRFNCSPE